MGLAHAVAPRDQPWKCSLAPGANIETPFTSDELSKIRGYMLANVDIEGSGAVAASPDHHTPGGDYYWHWERDGALTMHALLSTSTVQDVQDHLNNYLSWLLKHQTQPVIVKDLDVRIEPKFYIPTGRLFTDPWCRPQNDGPGLRAKTLAEYGIWLLQNGQADLVKTYLWTGNISVHHGGLVKHDLEWVSSGWKQDGCDLWEEARSADFFWNRFTMRAGLEMGARLAEQMGDSESASKYRNVKAEIEASLMDHWDDQEHFIFEDKDRRKDAAVIEAFNVGYLDDDVFHPLSREVLGTVIVLNQVFCSYDINRKDTEAGVPGILYGRYKGDTYAGGNPWVLLTASLARLLYRQALAAAEAASVDQNIYDLLVRAYNIPEDLQTKELGDALLAAGDGVMLRIRHHVEAYDFHMAEQIDRNDGSAQSAKDLTWNYANILLADKAREDYVQHHPKSHRRLMPSAANEGSLGRFRRSHSDVHV